jgi:hypothetical protein
MLKSNQGSSYKKYGVRGDPWNKNKKKFDRQNLLAEVAKKRASKPDNSPAAKQRLVEARRTINMFPMPKKKKK